tara:strand:+ start:36 stop:143 length:108 start_codon:yes stop_codon:yes gene_type:complete
VVEAVVVTEVVVAVLEDLEHLQEQHLVAIVQVQDH